MQSISQDELMAELLRSQREVGRGRSTDEWAEALGCSDKIALKYLNRAQRAGRLKREWRTTTRLDGKPYPQPVYTILAPPKTKPRAK